MCMLAALLCAVTEGKVDGKRRVKHDAPSDEPTIADKLWTYFKILLGALCFGFASGGALIGHVPVHVFHGAVALFDFIQTERPVPLHAVSNLALR